MTVPKDVGQQNQSPNTTATTTTPAKNENPTSPFQSSSSSDKKNNPPLQDLTIEGHVLFATDDWFAAAENLLHSSPPTFIPDLYCPEGKVMDGWETRRRRLPGHDWCVIKLGGRGGSIAGLEIDTAHFTGNHVPQISIEAVNLSHLNGSIASTSWMPGALERIVSSEDRRGTGSTPEQVDAAQRACSAVGVWKTILPQTELHPGYEETRMHRFIIKEAEDEVFTHIRVNYHPDGGVARLRVWGVPSSSGQKPPLYSPAQTSELCTVVPHSASSSYFPPAISGLELSSSTLGGRGVHCSNHHYGEPQNLVQPMSGRDMGDGWETARHPDRPSIWVRNESSGLLDSNLMDWAVLKLGSIADEGIARIVLDTKHFRGNFPESAMVEGCYIDDTHIPDNEVADKAEWFSLIPRNRLGPDSLHIYDAEKSQIHNHSGKRVSHVKVTIYPDGGLSRVRVYGKSSDGMNDVHHSRL